MKTKQNFNLICFAFLHSYDHCVSPTKYILSFNKCFNVTSLKLTRLRLHTLWRIESTAKINKS